MLAADTLIPVFKSLSDEEKIRFMNLANKMVKTINKKPKSKAQVFEDEIRATILKNLENNRKHRKL